MQNQFISLFVALAATTAIAKAQEWKHGLEDGETSVTLPAHSFTVIRL